MAKLDFISKQPGAHAHKQAADKRPGIANLLNRKFKVSAPNQAGCGDITYRWAQGRWHYLAVVPDLYTRRIVGWALSDATEHESSRQLLE